MGHAALICSDGWQSIELARTTANKPVVATRFARTQGSDRLRDAHELPNVAIDDQWSSVLQT